MNLKVHLLNSHIDHFPKILETVVKNEGERFHQDIKKMEKIHQGYWEVGIVAYSCCMIHREIHRYNSSTEINKKKLFLIKIAISIILFISYWFLLFIKLFK